MIREQFLSVGEGESWNRHLPARSSVFGSHGYARVCERFRKCSPRLYVAEMGESRICYPILFRSLSDLAFASNTDGSWDTTTPDFTGPMMFGRESALAELFPSLRDRAFSEEGVVAEFAHLHPWRESEYLLGEGRAFNREIVWVDTELNQEEMWRTQLEHSCRKNIHTAERHGVRVFEGSTDGDIWEFYRIYKATMERSNALPDYDFSFEFFQAFRDELPDNCRFAMAEYRDQIVAATLYLYDDDDVFSFLGGSDAEFHYVRPTNMLIWETINWARHSGKKRLILGGGYKPNDGILRFKSTFSKLRKPFHVYKRIHHELDYVYLDWRCREHYFMQGEPIAYFPSYRYSGLPAGEKVEGEKDELVEVG